MTKSSQSARAEIRKYFRELAKTAKHITVEGLAAFTGYPAGLQECIVDANGTISVYDSVANAYTSIHSISFADQSRIRQAVTAGKRFL